LSAPVIEVQGACKRFDEIRAVDDVSFVVPVGMLFGLIGHNGAGKSTLIRLMLGLIGPDSGSISILGEPVGGPRFRDVRRHVGYLPENVTLYDNLTGEETLRFYAELKGVATGACAPLLETLGLTHAARRSVRTYSKGMRQRLGFAQALLGDPRVLFLDEPTSGLDPEGVREFYRFLFELRDRGVTILLSSHNLAQIQDRVDALALLRDGQLQAAGTVQQLREALNLPVTIRASPHEGIDGRVHELLAHLPGCSVRQGPGPEFLITCGQRDKVTVLTTLLASDHLFNDLRIQEPSLEDVFLGFATEKSDGLAAGV
jgi:Cu-processing system ATP-binding protein